MQKLKIICRVNGPESEELRSPEAEAKGNDADQDIVFEIERSNSLVFAMYTTNQNVP